MDDPVSPESDRRTLQRGEIKLSSVASNVLGKSGRAMLEAMIASETHEVVMSMSKLAQKRLKRKKPELIKALHILIGPHQRLMLEAQLRHVDDLDALIQQLDEEIKRRMPPFEENLEWLDSLPGVARRTADHILAEIGTDMTQFSSAAHLCSWEGLAPGNHESAGKRKSGRTTKGNQKLRSTLVEATRAAALMIVQPKPPNRRQTRSKPSYCSRGTQHLDHCVPSPETETNLHRTGTPIYEERKRQHVVKQAIRKLKNIMP